jgi:hypothetical protein
MKKDQRKKLTEEKRQATLKANRTKREAQDLRARMADYFYSHSEPIKPLSA